MSNPIKLLPWSTITEALEDLHEAGWSKDQACDTIAHILDETVALDQVLPGPGGAAAEAIDGPVFRALVGLAWDLIAKADPTKKSERKAARALRRAQRIAERARHPIGEVPPEIAGDPTTAQ